MGRYNISNTYEDDEDPWWLKWLLKAVGIGLLCGFVAVLQYCEKKPASPATPPAAVR